MDGPKAQQASLAQQQQALKEREAKVGFRPPFDEGMTGMKVEETPSILIPN